MLLGAVLLANVGCSAEGASSEKHMTAPGPEAVGAGEQSEGESLQTEAAYTLDTNPDLPNPERGVAYWKGVAPLDQHTLEYHFLWLGGDCGTALDWKGRNAAGTSPTLNEWANAAVALRDAGKKVIFRPRYDTLGALEGAPNSCGKVEGASYAVMKGHVEAIAAMLADREIAPTIAFIEMGYLGSWGEWNTGNAGCGTVYADCLPFAPVLLAGQVGEDRITFAKLVIDTYRAAGMTRSVALRRPEYHRDAVEGLQVSTASLGFYNDCFMANDVDAGTFTPMIWDYVGLPLLYEKTLFQSVDAARSYLQSNAGNGSVGGETCPYTGSEPWRTPEAVLKRLAADGFHYLHGKYAAGFRDAMVPDGTWDVIKSRLGYRYHVTKVTSPSAVAPGASVTISIDIDNSGFAKIPYDRTAYTVLRGSSSYVVGVKNPRAGTFLPIAPETQSNELARTWDSGKTTTFTQTFRAPEVAGTYRLQLYIPDTDCVDNAFCNDAVNAQYAVRLATKRDGANVFDATTGTNDLGITLTVEPSRNEPSGF